MSSIPFDRRGSDTARQSPAEGESGPQGAGPSAPSGVQTNETSTAQKSAGAAKPRPAIPTQGKALDTLAAGPRASSASPAMHRAATTTGHAMSAPTLGGVHLTPNRGAGAAKAIKSLSALPDAKAKTGYQRDFYHVTEGAATTAQLQQLGQLCKADEGLKIIFSKSASGVRLLSSHSIRDGQDAALAQHAGAAGKPASKPPEHSALGQSLVFSLNVLGKSLGSGADKAAASGEAEQGLLRSIEHQLGSQDPAAVANICREMSRMMMMRNMKADRPGVYGGLRLERMNNRFELSESTKLSFVGADPQIIKEAATFYANVLRAYPFSLQEQAAGTNHIEIHVKTNDAKAPPAVAEQLGVLADAIRQQLSQAAAPANDK